METNETNVETLPIVLHETRIARRGKGAKGSVECQTIGKPVCPEGSLIAKTFDYSDTEKFDTEQLIEKAKELGNLNRILAMGMDMILRKSAIASGNEKTMLRMRLVKEGLADKKSSVAVAQAMIAARNAMGLSFDELITARKAKMEKDKVASGAK